MVNTEQKEGRGGAREGAGRKAKDGATGVVIYPIKLQQELKAWCQRVGPAHVRKTLLKRKNAMDLAKKYGAAIVLNDEALIDNGMTIDEVATLLDASDLDLLWHIKEEIEAIESAKVRTVTYVVGDEEQSDHPSEFETFEEAEEHRQALITETVSAGRCSAAAAEEFFYIAEIVTTHSVVHGGRAAS